MKRIYGKLLVDRAGLFNKKFFSLCHFPEPMIELFKSVVFQKKICAAKNFFFVEFLEIFEESSKNILRIAKFFKNNLEIWVRFFGCAEKWDFWFPVVAVSISRTFSAFWNAAERAMLRKSIFQHLRTFAKREDCSRIAKIS